MSKELYKRFRPKTLDRVVGNTETVAALKAMLEEETLPHTILFSGPSGCGKTSLARILRNELQCHEMDFVEMNCSSFRGVDTVREIMRSMSLSPTGGPCRIWLLDEVHQMTKDAQNAALKMLEDTPSHVYFFLCTTDPHKLLPTIRSRCCDMPVRLLDEEELTLLARRVARKEAIELSDDVVSELATLAAGSARTCLVLLDKVRNVDEADQIEAMRVANEEAREAIELCRALIKKQSWDTIAKILKGLKGDPEAVRWAVLGYARSVLLSGKNPQAYVVICAFENHFYDSKEAGLARACYEACFG